MLCALVVVSKGADEDAWLGIALVLTLVPITFIDLDHRIIPNRIVGPSAVVALVILALTDVDALPDHLIAAVAAGGFFLLAALAYPRGMGMGDVKLAALLGLYLGSSVAPALLAAMLSGTLVGGAIIARKGVAEGRKTAVPFGPFLALGALVGSVRGPRDRRLVPRHLPLAPRRAWTNGVSALTGLKVSGRTADLRLAGPTRICRPTHTFPPATPRWQGKPPALSSGSTSSPATSPPPRRR